MREFTVKIAFGTSSDKLKTGKEISPKLTAWAVFVIGMGGLFIMKVAGVI